MAQARAKVLPQRRADTGIIRGKEQRQHKEQTARARGSDKKAERQRNADRKFTVGDQESDCCGVRQDEVSKNRDHKRVSAAFLKPLVDPELKATVKSELGAEDFVFAEDQEEAADGDAEEG